MTRDRDYFITVHLSRTRPHVMTRVLNAQDLEDTAALWGYTRMKFTSRAMLVFHSFRAVFGQKQQVRMYFKPYLNGANAFQNLFDCCYACILFSFWGPGFFFCHFFCHQSRQSAGEDRSQKMCRSTTELGMLLATSDDYCSCRSLTGRDERLWSCPSVEGLGMISLDGCSLKIYVWE